MSKAEKAEAVFRALLKELGVNATEEQGLGVLGFKSEEYKFTLNIYRGEDGNFEKTVLENSTEGEESCKKFGAVVDALSELLKAMTCEQPKDEGESKETGEEKSEEKPDAEAIEEKKDDGSEANEAEAQAEEKPAEPET